MKRATSIFFIMLASVAILAHAAIPHHHHNGFFASLIRVLDADTQERFRHSHNPYFHYHELNKPKAAGYDFSKGANVRVNKDTSCWYAHFYDNQAACIQDDISPVASSSDDNGTFPPYVFIIHLNDNESCDGLRAPPIC